MDTIVNHAELALTAAIAGTLALLILVWLMFRLVNWAKRTRPGAYLLLALFPLLSLFPVPPSEVKKIEQIKQQQRKQQQGHRDPHRRNDDPR